MPARLQLFGVPTLARADGSWALPFERRSQLLVLLALRRGWVGRAEVAALLWPEQDNKLAYTNLRKTLHRLQLLPWGRDVQTQGGALRFDGDTDVALFEAAVGAERLAEALALRQGELLKGFDDDANDAWSHWLTYERERQRVTWRGAALAWLAGEVPGPAAVAVSAQLLDADPLDDAALRGHVGWLMRTGQAAAARQTCDRFIERLDTELGLAPNAELRKLRASLDAGAVAVPAPVAPVARPGPGTDEGFIGRGVELRRIASLLEQDDCRLLSLLGPGGVGKTRLARRALQELAPGFAQGVGFVSLEDVADAAGLGERLARELSVPPSGRGDALSEAMAALAGRHMLLVLDNFEALVPQAALLQRILDACGGVKLLVTSRTRLAVAGEWCLGVEGLPCPGAEDLDRVEAFDAVRLFARSARRVEPDWQPGAEAAAVVDICHLVEGMPLALELAAAWVRVLSCTAIASELRAGTELLRAEDPALPPRHASIEQVFDQSWKRLTPPERDVLARLGVFRGGFTPQAARAVARASMAVLGALADKSLLQKDELRLRLHPLVQQLATARLDEPLRHATAEAHAAHYLRVLAASRRAVELGERSALQQLERDVENCRAAWQHAASFGVAAQGDSAAGRAQARMLADGALSLMSHCDHRGLRQEGLAMGRWAGGSAAAAVHASLRAVLLAACAHLEYRLDRGAEAIDTANAAFAVAGEPPNHDAQVLALKVLGSCALRQSRFDDARQHYEHARRLAAAGSDPHNSAAILGNLAIVEKRSGHYPESLRLALASLQEYRRLGDVANEALALCNLGTLHRDLGEYEASEAHQREALALCERHGLPATQGIVLVNLCDLAERAGDLQAARRHGLRALELIEQVGDRSSLATVRANLASIALRQGDPGTARAELSAAMRHAQSIGQPWVQLFGVIVLAMIVAGDGDTRGARQLLQFAAEHPAAPSNVRGLARQQLAALPDAAEPLTWPGLDLAELVHRAIVEDALAHAPLRLLLRGVPQ